MEIQTGTMIEGAWRDGSSYEPVKDKFTDAELASIALSDEHQVNETLRAARYAFETGLPLGMRVELLERASDHLAEVAEDLADLICGETGKVIADARGEVRRTVSLLRTCAEEALRLGGDVMPQVPGKDGKLAFRQHEPVGVVAAIAPFNGPLILMAHKVGPALAAGNAVVGKPALEAPVSAVVLFEALRKAVEDVKAPAGIVGLVQGGADVGRVLTESPEVDLVSFTGGARTGDVIARSVGLKPTIFELGGNSAAIVAQDADLELTVESAVRQSFQHAGQVCISLQRIYVHESIKDEFTARFLARTDQIQVGDPRDPEVHMGPVLRDTDADRIAAWTDRACDAGGERLLGGRREGRLMWPTVLADVPEDEPIVAEEVFGPVVSILGYSDEDDVVGRVNQGPYGLQAGVFSGNLNRAFKLARAVNVRGVQINDGPGFREDTWPYGGRKGSGRGTEGPHWAIREMSVEKLFVVTL